MTSWHVTQENEHAFLSEADGVVTVVLNRPEKLNAVSPPITDMLWRGAEALADRSDLRAMVITGLGRYFTAGIDLSMGPRGRTADTPLPSEPSAQWRRAYRRHGMLRHRRVGWMLPCEEMSFRNSLLSLLLLPRKGD